MSVTVGFDINFYAAIEWSILDVVKDLQNIGWNLKNNKNEITFLPANDKDEFNWYSEHISEKILFEIVKNKETLKEIVGIVMYWGNTEVGITLLMKNVGKLTISLDINRVKIEGKNKTFTDVDWYLKRTIYCMRNIENFSFEEF